MNILYLNNMIRTYLFVLLFGLFYSQNLLAIPDTVYFNEEWNLCSEDNFSYFRVLEVEDDVVSVVDHYDNGVIQMIGAIKYSEESLELAKKSHELDGYEVGEFSWCFPNGRIYRSLNFDPSLESLTEELRSDVDAGSLMYEKTYAMNGQITEEGLILPDGTFHGDRIVYHPEGGKKSLTTYNKGVIVGTRFTYATNGTMTSSTEYKNGKKDGTQKLFDYLGRLKTTREYENGDVVKEKKRYLGFTRIR